MGSSCQPGLAAWLHWYGPWTSAKLLSVRQPDRDGAGQQGCQDHDARLEIGEWARLGTQQLFKPRTLFGSLKKCRRLIDAGQCEQPLGEMVRLMAQSDRGRSVDDGYEQRARAAENQDVFKGVASVEARACAFTSSASNRTTAPSASVDSATSAPRLATSARMVRRRANSHSVSSPAATSLRSERVAFHTA